MLNNIIVGLMIFMLILALITLDVDINNSARIAILVADSLNCVLFSLGVVGSYLLRRI